MIINLQHTFKSPNCTPGPDGQELCVDKYLTEYAQELGVSSYVIQVWEGQGDETKMTNLIIFDSKTNKPVFMDHRSQVIEYMIEKISEQSEHKDDE